jgi:peroxiredoxin Q/BCP
MALAAGEQAPEFDLFNQDGDSCSLDGLKGKQVVLFFYPKANTPGCTIESIDFTNLKADFAAANTVLLGCSRDSVKVQCRFRDKKDLTVTLLSDPDHATHEAYGAWGLKKFMGRESITCIRTTVLIDAAGAVRQVWSPVRVKGHAQAVLDAVRAP